MRRAALAACLLPTLLCGADYERDIKPLLQERCFACHGALKQKAGLRLDTVALMRSGGDEGDVLKAAHSLLVERVTATDEHDLMPPEGEGARFNAEQVALLREWIAAWVAWTGWLQMRDADRSRLLQQSRDLVAQTTARALTQQQARMKERLALPA